MVTTFIVKHPRKRSRPITNIRYTAKILDDRRLGKQRVEAKQIIDAIEKGGKGWSRHPATAAWRYYPIDYYPQVNTGSVSGRSTVDILPSSITPHRIDDAYLPALKLYHDIMVREWIRRGKNNNMKLYYTDDEYESFINGMWRHSIPFPEWCSIDSVQYSHMARLIQKDPGYYQPKFPEIPIEYLEYGYIWPAKWTLEQLRGDVVELETVADTVPVENVQSGFSSCTEDAVQSSLKRKLDLIAEPFVDYPICIGETVKGAACRNKATRGEFCGVHGEPLEIVICSGEFKNGNPCTYRAVDGEYCKRHSVR